MLRREVLSGAGAVGVLVAFLGCWMCAEVRNAEEFETVLVLAEEVDALFLVERGCVE